MKFKKILKLAVACTVIFGTAFYSLPDLRETSVYAADASASGNIKVKPVYEDFNANDVNGSVEIVLPEGITAKIAITFDSAEGKGLSYYDSLISGGYSYTFDVEGTLESEDRLYSLSILPISAEGFEAVDSYTEQFSVKDGDNFPDSFTAYRYDIKYNYDFEGESWKITGSEGGDKEITFSFFNYSIGDVDMDGKITAYDAACVLTEYATLSAGKESTLNSGQRLVADVDKDNKITAYDASIILTNYARISAGKEPIWD